MRRLISLLLVLTLIPALPAKAALDPDTEIRQMARTYAAMTSVPDTEALAMFMMAVVPVESGINSDLIVPVPYSDEPDILYKYSSTSTYGLRVYGAGTYQGPLQVSIGYTNCPIDKAIVYTGDRHNLYDSFNYVAGVNNRNFNTYIRRGYDRVFPSGYYQQILMYSIAHNFGGSVLMSADTLKPYVGGESYTPVGAFNWAKILGSDQIVNYARELLADYDFKHYDGSAAIKELMWKVYCRARVLLIRVYGSFDDAGISASSEFKSEIYYSTTFKMEYFGSRNGKLTYPLKVLMSCLIMEERYG